VRVGIVVRIFSRFSTWSGVAVGKQFTPFELTLVVVEVLIVSSNGIRKESPTIRSPLAPRAI